jgi:ABC-type Fe3+ transport system permease subunit
VNERMATDGYAVQLRILPIRWISSFAFSFGELALVAFLFGPNSSVLSTLFLGLATRGELERAAVIGLLSTCIVLVVVALVRRLTRTSIAEGVH